MKKILDLIFYAGFGAQFFEDNKDEIASYNARIMELLGIGLSVVLAINALVSTALGIDDQKIMLVCFMLVAAIFTLVFWRKKNRSARWTGGMLQFMIIWCSAFLLWNNLSAPQDLAVFLPMAIVLIPVIFIVRPIYMITYQAAMAVVFTVTTIYFKQATEYIVFYDLVDYAICLILAHFVGYSSFRSKCRVIELRAKDNERNENRLAKALMLANKDPLTGVRSRAAFETAKNEMDYRINSGDNTLKFAVVECDTNNLKEVNDALGHEAGDEMLITCCRRICDICHHSEVYRIGGDEFVALLMDEDYENRAEILKQLREVGSQPYYSFATGIKTYSASHDKNFEAVYVSADYEMFAHKEAMKKERKEGWFEESLKYRNK